MNIISKIVFNSAIGALGISTLAVASVSAATVSFELNFFDDSNVQIGTGEFSYDDRATSTCLEFLLGEPDFSCASDLSDFNLSDGDRELIEVGAIVVSEIGNVLTDFEANINGVEWGFDANTTWWGDESRGQLPGYIAQSRDGSRKEENSWFFGDGFLGIEQLRMDFLESSDTAGRGTFNQSVTPSSDLLPPGADFVEDSGTWQATRIETENPSETVPESTNVIGVLMAMGLGYSLLGKSTKKMD